MPPIPNKKAAAPHRNRPVPILTEPRYHVTHPIMARTGMLRAAYLEMLYNVLNIVIGRFDA